MGFLCLARRQGESVLLTLKDGRQIHVKVSDLRWNMVVLAIDAPRDIEVMRPDAVRKVKKPGA